MIKKIQELRMKTKKISVIVPVYKAESFIRKNLEEMKKQANPKVGQMIKELSRLTYGRDREVVEAEINKRSRL